MALLDDLKQLEVKQVKPCAVIAATASLADNERAAVLEAVDNNVVSARRLETALLTNGVQLGRESILLHRRKACRCVL